MTCRSVRSSRVAMMKLDRVMTGLCSYINLIEWCADIFLPEGRIHARHRKGAMVNMQRPRNGTLVGLRALLDTLMGTAT